MKKYQYQTEDNKYNISFFRDPGTNTIVVETSLLNARGISGTISMTLGSQATDELDELIQEIRNTPES